MMLSSGERITEAAFQIDAKSFPRRSTIARPMKSRLHRCNRRQLLIPKISVSESTSPVLRQYVHWPQNWRGLAQFLNANNYSLASSSGLHPQRIKVGKHETNATA